jgi:uncharacterized protein YdiU (UPF0061 family)
MSITMSHSRLEDLDWDDRFVRSLPADPDETNRTRQVVGAAYSKVTPTPVASPTLLAHSKEVAEDLDMAPELVQSPEFASAFGGNSVVTGMAPYAACYGGHQFGNWAGQLGDGRAITLGEVVNQHGARFELQLKGAGPTPYSRFADGRAVLRSSIREFLCSETMHHLGVPTTRALSLIGTGDPIMRDMFYNGYAAAEPGAVVCRVAPSFLRFGSYQIHSARGDVEMLRKMVGYTLQMMCPALGEVNKASVLVLLEEVAKRTAVLMAEWMRVGFVHGVMNTDNMSILGLTIDYGPYGWIDNYDPEWTPNTTDAGMRRYRFGLQPKLGGWNLVRLAEALFPLIDDVPAIEQAIDAYETAWNAASQRMIAGKLGFESFQGAADTALWVDLIKMLQRVETDMTLFFRALSNVGAEGDPIEVIEDAFYVPLASADRDAWLDWFARYRRRISVDARPHAERKAAMDATNPWFVLRNYLAQEAIELAEKGDMSRVHALLDVARNPYTEQSKYAQFAGKRPEWARNKPGCSTLSCSS